MAFFWGFFIALRAWGWKKAPRIVCLPLIPALGAMPNADDFHGFPFDSIDDHIGPKRQKLARARHKTGTAPLWQILQPVAGGDDLNGYAVGGLGIVLPNMIPNTSQILKGFRRQDYGHSGGGNSLLVPQDNSQSRICS